MSQTPTGSSWEQAISRGQYTVARGMALPATPPNNLATIVVRLLRDHQKRLLRSVIEAYGKEYVAALDIPCAVKLPTLARATLGSHSLVSVAAATAWGAKHAVPMLWADGDPYRAHTAPMFAYSYGNVGLLSSIAQGAPIEDIAAVFATVTDPHDVSHLVIALAHRSDLTILLIERAISRGFAPALAAVWDLCPEHHGRPFLHMLAAAYHCRSSLIIADIGAKIDILTGEGALGIDAVHHGAPAILFALLGNNYIVANVLLERGADPNPALLYYAKQTCPEMRVYHRAILLLLSYGARPYTMVVLDNTWYKRKLVRYMDPHRLAAITSNDAAAKTLIARGITPTASTLALHDTKKIKLHRHTLHGTWTPRTHTQYPRFLRARASGAFFALLALRTTALPHLPLELILHIVACTVAPARGATVLQQQLDEIAHSERPSKDQPLALANTSFPYLP